jgi:hypothetical protein
MMKTFTRGALAAVLIAAGIAASGCASTIDEGKAADFVKKSFDNRDSVKIRDASCPKDVEARKGKTFVCRVTWVDGDTGTVTLHMTSDDGKVQFGQDDVRVDS